LVVSTCAVACGLIAGVIMNLNRWGVVGWADRGVMLSLLLFVWLAVATVVEFSYAPTSHGRKAVYMTLASLGFLILAMFGLLTTSHGQSGPASWHSSGAHWAVLPDGDVSRPGQTSQPLEHSAEVLG
jgi:hypothetical protein